MDEGVRVPVGVAVWDAVDGAVAEWDGVTRVYDPAGVEQDMDWLASWFGGEVRVVRVEPSERHGYVVRCVELRTKDAEATQVVQVQGVDGAPLAGAAVARWWDSAPALKEFPEGCVASRWFSLGVIGITKLPEGDVGFGMGSGDKPGSSAVWVVHCEGASDLVDGLGWGVGEAHRVVRPVFRVLVAGEDPEPEPEPEDGELVEAIAALGTELMGIRAALEFIGTQLAQGWSITGR